MNRGKSRAVPPLEPKRCSYCQGVMSERRGVVLIETNSGALVGPFHAGCADKLLLKCNHKQAYFEGQLADFHIYGQVPREETLPW